MPLYHLPYYMTLRNSYSTSVMCVFDINRTVFTIRIYEEGSIFTSPSGDLRCDVEFFGIFGMKMKKLAANSEQKRSSFFVSLSTTLLCCSEVQCSVAVAVPSEKGGFIGMPCCSEWWSVSSGKERKKASDCLISI